MVGLFDASDRTFGASRPNPSETQVAVPAGPPGGPPRSKRAWDPLPKGQTALRVDDTEQGQEDARDSFHERRSAPAATPAAAGTSGEIARSALAKELLTLLESVEHSLGQPACATPMQLFKRQLARCHVELDGVQSEADSLSIVSLIESSLAGLTWKQYTLERLAAVRQALQLAYEKPRLTYDDYQAVRRAFRQQGIETAPTLDLAVLDTEGWDDEEEVDAP